MAPNLTREEARERAALITVTSYQVDLDLTGGTLDAGEHSTFGSRSVIRFSCAAPGAGTFVDLTAPAVTGITLNGEPVTPGAFDGERIALAGLAAENVLVVDADCAYSRSGDGLHRFADPADGSVYLYSNLEPYGAHRIYACFDQPDLKASYELSVTAPADWQVVSNMAPDTDEAVTGRPGTLPRAGGGSLPHPRADIRHPRLGRPVPRGTGRVRWHRAGHLLPPVASGVPGPGGDLHHHQAGLRLLPLLVRHRVSVRQVRPALRARVQGRRDGERRRGDDPGRLRVPVAGDRRLSSGARRGDPARDGAHVVR